ncbi:ead/Ea22-like family protein [Klebsiella pneumoniae]|uniref:ead/Ea22-like family protein n=1 Tax=Klebsiella pneumoniae TaxID=573 RepID=UPI000E2D9BA1|nr:ead/Ea22-like family protein [Klebsiella pneumoniae]SXG44767.1 RelE family toxin-antitoxin system [Klebsiella pneumoniae]
MTDITELAQSLKAAAENAIGAHERLAAYPYGEIIDISQHEGEQIDIDITDINEFHEEANPVNVLALVEALDKAQQQMTESENRVRKQNRHICELFDDNTALRQRIAELESRTVKLPEPEQWDITQVLLCKKKVVAAIRAAGIKVEAE